MKHIVDGVDQPGDSRVRRKLRVAMDLNFNGWQREGQREDAEGLVAVKALRDASGENDGEIGVLNDLRRNDKMRQAQHDIPAQIQLFEPVNGQIADRIRKLKLDELRPIEALQLLAELQKELK